MEDIEGQTLYVEVRGAVRQDELDGMVRPHFGSEDPSVREMMEERCLAEMGIDIGDELRRRNPGAKVDAQVWKGGADQKNRLEFRVHVTGGTEEDRKAAEEDVARWLASEYEPDRETIARALNELTERYPVRVSADDARAVFGELRDGVTADVYLSVEQAAELTDLLDRYGRNPDLCAGSRSGELRSKLAMLANERVETARVEPEEPEHEHER